MEGRGKAAQKVPPPGILDSVRGEQDAWNQTRESDGF